MKILSLIFKEMVTWQLTILMSIHLVHNSETPAFLLFYILMFLQLPPTFLRYRREGLKSIYAYVGWIPSLFTRKKSRLKALLDFCATPPFWVGRCLHLRSCLCLHFVFGFVVYSFKPQVVWPLYLLILSGRCLPPICPTTESPIRPVGSTLN